MGFIIIFLIISIIWNIIFLLRLDFIRKKAEDQEKKRRVIAESIDVILAKLERHMEKNQASESHMAGIQFISDYLLRDLLTGQFHKDLLRFLRSSAIVDFPELCRYYSGCRLPFECEVRESVEVVKALNSEKGKTDTFEHHVLIRLKNQNVYKFTFYSDNPHNTICDLLLREDDIIVGSHWLEFIYRGKTVNIPVCEIDVIEKYTTEFST